MFPQTWKARNALVALAFLLTTAATALGQTYCGLPDDGTTVLTPSDYSIFTPPALGASYTEEFGTTACTVYRATDSTQSSSGNTVIDHQYATQDPFNADDTLMWVFDNTGAAWIVKNPAAGNGSGIVVKSSALPSSTYYIALWDATTPNVLYEGNGSNVVKWTIGGTNCSSAAGWSGAPNCTVSATTLYTSPSYTNLQFNEQPMCDDGLHFWIADATQDTGSTAHFLLMTLNQNDATSAALTTTVTLPSGYHKPGCLPNNYLYINGDSGNDVIYKTDGTVLINTLSSQGGHVDFGNDLVTGDPVGVSIWYQGSSSNGCPGQYGIGVLDLNPSSGNYNKVIRCLANELNDYDYTNGGGWGGHYSWRDTSAGWVVGEAQSGGTNCPSSSARDCFNSVQPPNNWDHMAEEIYAMKEDGSTIQRLIHYRSRTGGKGGGYWSQPRPVISRDGKYIAFDSNFDISTNSGGDTADGTVNVFVIPFQPGSAPPPPPAPPTGLSATVN